MALGAGVDTVAITGDAVVGFKVGLADSGECVVAPERGDFVRGVDVGVVDVGAAVGDAVGQRVLVGEPVSGEMLVGACVAGDTVGLAVIHLTLVPFCQTMRVWMYSTEVDSPP